MITSAETEREISKVDAESRAIVPVAPAATRELSAQTRGATFLAHLIATRDQFPQTRERRRAEPAQAVNAYRAMAALTARR